MTEWIVAAEDFEDLYEGRVVFQRRLVRCKDCKWLWKHHEGDTHKVNLSMYRCLKYHNPDTENFYCGDGERDEVRE